MPALLWTLICTNVLFGQKIHIWIIFSAIIIKKKIAETVLSNGAIWDEFSEQHHHESIQKANLCQ